MLGPKALKTLLLSWACVGAVALAAPAVDGGSPSDEGRVVPRQNPAWSVTFYADHDCSDFIGTFGSDAAGSPQDCTTEGVEIRDSYSLKWTPGTGNELYVSSNDHCSNGCCGQTFGSDDGGCHQYTQNVNPPGSWRVSRVS